MVNEETKASGNWCSHSKSVMEAMEQYGSSAFISQGWIRLGNIA